jgi:hypothetical protein
MMFPANSTLPMPNISTVDPLFPGGSATLFTNVLFRIAPEELCHLMAR